jgi:glutathione S-transferase
MRIESLRPPDRQDAAAMSLHGNAIRRALEHAAGQVNGRPWCEGEALSLADLALVSALLYLDLRQPERDWRSLHPGLASWAARVCARPSVKASQAA